MKFTMAQTHMRGGALAFVLVITFHATGAGAQEMVFASDYNNNRVLKFGQADGSYLGVFASGNGLTLPDGMCFNSTGSLYVTSKTNSRVLEFDRSTGSFVRIVCTPPANLEDAQLGPDGMLYATRWSDRLIRKFSPTTGQALGTFGTATSLANPVNMAFGPDGNLYVAGHNSSNVAKLDGETGAFLGDFVPPGTGGIQGLEGIVFGPDGDLYVASRLNSKVIRFDGESGAFLGVLATLPADSGHLQGLTFLCNGNLLVSTYQAGDIYELDSTSGTIVRVYNNPGGNRSSGLLAWPGQPQTIRPPRSAAVCPTGTAIFTVVAAGSGPFSYQWRKDGVELTDGLTEYGSTIDGSVTDTLSIRDVGSADAGADTYDCVVTNSCGSVTSNAASLTVLGAPPASLQAVLSRKFHAGTLGRFEDLNVNIAGQVQNDTVTSDPLEEGISELHLIFDVSPNGPCANPVSILEQSCGSCPCPAGTQTAYAAYSGAAVMASSLLGDNELVLTFSPPLENLRTYKFTIESETTSIPGQSFELRALKGDVNNDGRVNGSDRSAVVAAWTSPANYSPETDIDLTGRTNGSDRSLIVSIWTGADRCAP